MPNPATCQLRTDPETVLADKMASRFELVEEITKSSHHWRYLLACRACGQRYFFEFYEEVDWQDGDDPSWMTYVPILSDEDLGHLTRQPPRALAMSGRERLCIDHPKGGPKTIAWVTG